MRDALIRFATWAESHEDLEFFGELCLICGVVLVSVIVLLVVAGWQTEQPR